MQSEFPWSRVPAEIAHEIAAHNADDVPSLRAMCLVSQTMRFLAIEHLFAFIHFAREQDFSWWAAMLHRTPRLRTIVKKVKFSYADFEDKAWIMRHREVYSPKRLHEAVVPPQIPTMPNIRVVEWEGNEWERDPGSFPISMAVASMALFPNINELHLRYVMFDSLEQVATLLGACGRLRVLSVCCTDVVQPDLPAFLALHTLSISLTEAELVLNALDAAPALTALVLPILLFNEDEGRDLTEFTSILHTVFPWGPHGQSQSMKSILTRKFPLLRRLRFQFCLARNSTIHFRRGLRRRMERQLRERLEQTGAEVAGYFDFELEWLDDDYRPVVYNKANGKPQWQLHMGIPEPETEESDCEVEDEPCVFA
ncbi:hypothetical protein DFH06DRAFT_182351 [Mycena polygramma]|nr:hypothetical protein DFH06DRAFT_182351 [Mycena polygramma]